MAGATRKADAPSGKDPEAPKGGSGSGSGSKGGGGGSGPPKQPAQPPKQPDPAPPASKAPESCAVPNSFTPDTGVVMADGSTKRIEDVRVGDLVLATDPKTGEAGGRMVLALIVGQGDKDLVEVTVDTDSDAGDDTGTVVATDGHPFWVENHGAWVDAKDLRPGDMLRTSAGTWVQVQAVHEFQQHQRVHNLTVADIHTYYVMSGDTSVLVHNSGCGGDSWASRGNLNRHFDDHGKEMGYESPAEYSAGAEDLMCTCAGRRPGVLQKRDGNTNYFLDPETGEFGITGEKGIVTYFKPDNPMDYFNRQPGVSVP